MQATTFRIFLLFWILCRRAWLVHCTKYHATRVFKNINFFTTDTIFKYSTLSKSTNIRNCSIKRISFRPWSRKVRKKTLTRSKRAQLACHTWKQRTRNVSFFFKSRWKRQQNRWKHSVQFWMWERVCLCVKKLIEAHKFRINTIKMKTLIFDLDNFNGMHVPYNVYTT